MLIFQFEVTKSEDPSDLSKQLVTMPTSDDETAVAPIHEGKKKQRWDIVQALLLMVVPGDVESKINVGRIKIRA